ncbi:MAG TPA: RES family NAD+ phosphorylase [Longimicrobiales bacterium]|nr:RES family NAD+ phosphorylase [Longimicrobiales bacterium]
MAATTHWRVFPWHEKARSGERFSASYLPSQSGQGRFDLPLGSAGSTLYLAGSPEHAIGEKLQHLRNRFLADEFLLEGGHRLALCPVEVAPSLEIADLCVPQELVARDVAPDRLAYRDRKVTRSIAAGLHEDEGLAGFRWWSALFGEWHTMVLFTHRLPEGALTFGAPTHLDLEHPDLVRAATALAIELEYD